VPFPESGPGLSALPSSHGHDSPVLRRPTRLSTVRTPMRLSPTIRPIQRALRSRYVRGLTLIEVLIVISIIVILSGLSLAVFKRSQEMANDQMTRSLLNTIISAASQYDLGLTEWPHAGHGLA